MTLSQTCSLNCHLQLLYLSSLSFHYPKRTHKHTLKKKSLSTESVEMEREAGREYKNRGKSIPNFLLASNCESISYKHCNPLGAWKKQDGSFSHGFPQEPGLPIHYLSVENAIYAALEMRIVSWA